MSESTPESDHPDHETPLSTPGGDTVSVGEALADPDGFVSGMSQETTYCLFVRVSPIALRAALGDGPETIEPFEYGGVKGSLVTLADRQRWKRLSEEFKNLIG